MASQGEEARSSSHPSSSSSAKKHHAGACDHRLVEMHTRRNSGSEEDLVSLELKPGENWLCWNEAPEEPLSLEIISAVDEPEKTPTLEQINHNTATASSSNGKRCCYLCLDVDGPLVTIKDMRSLYKEEQTGSSCWTPRLFPGDGSIEPIEKRKMRRLTEKCSIELMDDSGGRQLAFAYVFRGEMEEESSLRQAEQQQQQQQRESSSAASILYAAINGGDNNNNQENTTTSLLTNGATKASPRRQKEQSCSTNSRTTPVSRKQQQEKVATPQSVESSSSSVNLLTPKKATPQEPSTTCAAASANDSPTAAAAGKDKATTPASAQQSSTSDGTMDDDNDDDSEGGDGVETQPTAKFETQVEEVKRAATSSVDAANKDVPQQPPSQESSSSKEFSDLSDKNDNDDEDSDTTMSDDEGNASLTLKSTEGLERSAALLTQQGTTANSNDDDDDETESYSITNNVGGAVPLPAGEMKKSVGNAKKAEPPLQSKEEGAEAERVLQEETASKPPSADDKVSQEKSAPQAAAAGYPSPTAEKDDEDDETRNAASPAAAAAEAPVPHQEDSLEKKPKNGSVGVQTAEEAASIPTKEKPTFSQPLPPGADGSVEKETMGISIAPATSKAGEEGLESRQEEGPETAASLDADAGSPVVASEETIDQSNSPGSRDDAVEGERAATADEENADSVAADAARETTNSVPNAASGAEGSQDDKSADDLHALVVAEVMDLVSGEGVDPASKDDSLNTETESEQRHSEPAAESNAPEQRHSESAVESDASKQRHSEKPAAESKASEKSHPEPAAAPQTGEKAESDGAKQDAPTEFDQRDSFQAENAAEASHPIAGCTATDENDKRKDSVANNLSEDAADKDPNIMPELHADAAPVDMEADATAEKHQEAEKTASDTDTETKIHSSRATTHQHPPTKPPPDSPAVVAKSNEELSMKQKSETDSETKNANNQVNDAVLANETEESPEKKADSSHQHSLPKAHPKDLPDDVAAKSNGEEETIDQEQTETEAGLKEASSQINDVVAEGLLGNQSEESSKKGGISGVAGSDSPTASEKDLCAETENALTKPHALKTRSSAMKRKARGCNDSRALLASGTLSESEEQLARDFDAALEDTRGKRSKRVKKSKQPAIAATADDETEDAPSGAKRPKRAKQSKQAAAAAAAADDNDDDGTKSAPTAEGTGTKRPKRAKQSKEAAADNDNDETKDVLSTLSSESPAAGAARAPSAPLETPVASRPTRGATATRSTRKRKAAAASAETTGTKQSVSTRPARTPSRSTRRQGTPCVETSTAEDARILVTGLDLDNKQKKMVKSLGAVLIDDIFEAHTATHIIASDDKAPMRRTPKLMIALSCTTNNIVSLQWLTESHAANTLLPSDKFLVLDKDAEKKYSFSMKKTMGIIKSRLNNERPRLLEGWSVYICKGVAGNRAPDAKELRLMIEAAGGSWLTSCSKKGLDFSKLLIITSEPEPSKQVSVKAVSSALENGAEKRTTTWLFDALMKQQCDL